MASSPPSGQQQQPTIDSPTCSVGIDANIDRQPLIVPPKTGLKEAMRLMQGHKTKQRVSYTLVAEGSKLVGIITERDIVKLTAQSVSLEHLSVEDVMTRQLVTIQEHELSDCLSILELFRQHKIRHIPVIDTHLNIIGVATHSSICQAVKPTVLLKLRQVNEVMSCHIVSATATASVTELAKLMARQRVSCVVITAADSNIEKHEKNQPAPPPSTPLKPIGIVTERDIVQFQALAIDLQHTLAHTVMSTPLTCLNQTASLWTAHETMQQLKVRRLVIVDSQHNLAGILTQTSMLSVLNPLELCTTVNILQQQLDQLNNEKIELLRSLNQSLTTQVQDSEARFKATFEQAAAGIVHIDLQGKFLQVNQKFCDIVGYTLTELQNKTVADITAPESRQQDLESIQQLASGDITSFSQEKQYLRKDGSLVWASITRSRVVTANNNADYLVTVVTDITARKKIETELSLYQNHLQQLVTDRTAELQTEIDERKRIEQQLFLEKELAQVTLHAIGDAVMTTDANGRVNYLNPVAEKLTGWHNTAAIARPVSEVFFICDEATRKPLPSPIEAVLSSGHSTDLDNHTILVSRNGEEYGIDNSAAPLRNREGEIIGAVVVFRDATHARQVSKQLSWQAGHDALTNLVNRRKFEQILAETHEAIQPGQEHILCYLDLDQFKVVNDTCGHPAGDELLQQIATLLSQQIRAADTLARLGGDEFAILLHQCPIEQAVIIANQVRREIADFRFVWQQDAFQIGVSVGLVAINAESSSMADTLKAADAACYSAKEKGRNQVQVYQPDAAEIVEKRSQQQWNLRIKKALEAGRFCLYQQKIVPTTVHHTATNNTAINSASFTCAEVLLRMLDEKSQCISPAAFMPAAERYDLMPEIDRWVIKAFFNYLANHPSEPVSTAPSTEISDVSDVPLPPSSRYMLNLSGASVGNPQVLSCLKAQLTRHNINPRQVCFEITETVAIANLKRAIDFINELKQLGFYFALDDFGSGMSSFAYLKALPVDYIKIDGKFIHDIDTDPTALAIVEAINNIGHVMGLQTIAEFVETEQIQSSLRQIGVDFMQGYSIEKPHPLTA